MATTEISFNSSYPTVESTADFNETIDNATDPCSSRRSFGCILRDPFEVCLVCIQILLCLVIYTGNGLTLVATSMDKKLKQNMQNKYIMSLASADQITGLQLLQLLMKNYFMEESLWLSCQPHLVLLYTTNAVSLMNMLSIAVDRYFYIVHPFVHMRHVTPRRISICILVQWMLAGLYGIVPIYIFNADESKGCNPFYLLSRRFVTFTHPILFFIDCIGIGITYGLIAKVARQHSSRKTKRVQQINSVIANNTTNRGKSLDGNSVARDLKRNVVSGDVPKCVWSEQKNVNDVDGLTDGVTRASCKTKDEKVSGVLCVNLDRQGNNHTKENNIGTNNTRRSYLTNNIFNENTSVLTSAAENTFDMRHVDDKEINSADSGNEVMVFQTCNTGASAVNKDGARCVRFQSATGCVSRQSLHKVNRVLNNQDAIITSDTSVNETGCSRSDKIITENSDEIHNKRYFDIKDNTAVTSCNNKMQVESYLGNGGKTTTEITSNNVEDGTSLATSDSETTVNSDSAQSEASNGNRNNTLAVNNNEMHDEADTTANINIQTIHCDSSQDNASFGKSDNSTTEKCCSNAQVMAAAGNDDQPFEGQLCQTSQPASSWSLASLRWLKQMIVVFGLFVLCWTPTMVSILLSTVWEINQRVIYVLGMFGIANSAVNFFVYSVCNKTYLEAIKRMCRLRREK